MVKQKRTRYSSKFGSRYGVAVRRRFDLVEAKQRIKHICPKCGFSRVKRVSTGIFSCTKCHSKYAGGAYYPQTLSGSIVAKMVAQKAFSASLLEELAAVYEPPAKPSKEITPFPDESPAPMDPQPSNALSPSPKTKTKTQTMPEPKSAEGDD